MKISNDIRWLGSGPRAGIGEIMLPEIQPGSSIMPGKVNPVIPESVCQVAAQVIGNDAAVGVAGQSGNFEINVMMPVAAYNLLQSIDLLSASAANLSRQCVTGLTATSAGPDMVDRGLAIVTTLVPHIGYDASADIAKEAQATGQTVKEVALVRTDLSSEELDEILDPSAMTEPGLGSGVAWARMCRLLTSSPVPCSGRVLNPGPGGDIETIMAIPESHKSQFRQLRRNVNAT